MGSQIYRENKKIPLGRSLRGRIIAVPPHIYQLLAQSTSESCINLNDNGITG